MLKDIFISEVRVNILKVMLVNPDKSFHIRALVRSVGTEINAVRRELDRLTRVGLLRRRPSGNRVYYSVDTSSNIYPELLSLISKEIGLGAAVIKNKKALGDTKYAVLARAYSRGRVSTVLDVDLFIVGTVKIEVLEGIIEQEQRKRGSEINYSVMGEEEFEFRKRKSDQFVMRILTKGRTMLIGDEEEFSSV